MWIKDSVVSKDLYQIWGSTLTKPNYNQFPSLPMILDFYFLIR